MYFNVFTANLRHTYPRMLAHMPPITTTLPLPSNEGCRHCFSLSKEFRQVWGWQKGPWNGILIGCVEQTFLCCTADIPPAATLVVDPIVPRRYRQFNDNARDGRTVGRVKHGQQQHPPHNNRQYPTMTGHLPH
jgi:hypothetical protein